MEFSVFWNNSLLLFQLFKWTSFHGPLLNKASKVLGAAVGVVAQWWGLKKPVSISSLGTWETPSPTTLPLKPLPSGDWQTIQRSELCKWLHCWGQIESKKGASPRDREARWNKKVWLCGLKRAGMDQRAGCWPAAFVRQTALASFNLSLEAGKAHWDIVLHRSHALWGWCLLCNSSTYPSVSSSTPPPGTISQVKVDGRGLCVLRPNLSGIHHKESWALSPDARRPSLTLLHCIHMALLPPCPGSTGRAMAWRELEHRGALTRSPGDDKPQLCGKQRWT